MKKTVPIRPFWYTDKPVLPKLVTVITTVDKEGTVNAAPFAFFMQFDVMDTKPRILLGMRKFCHTYRNIEATGEFVINFPPTQTTRFIAPSICLQTGSLVSAIQ